MARVNHIIILLQKVCQDIQGDYFGGGVNWKVLQLSHLITHAK